MGLFPNIIGFGIGLVLWSLRSTMYSGTYDAYMYDELAHYDGTEYFGRVRSYAKIAQWAGVTLSAAGIWIYHEFGWSIIILCSVAVRILSFIMLYRMPEVGRIKPDHHISFLQQCRDSIYAMRDQPRIAWIGLYSCSFGFVYMFFEYRTLLAKDWSLSPTLTTVFVAGCSLALCVGSFFSARWRHDQWRWLFTFGFLIAAFLVIGFSGNYGFMSACCLLFALAVYQLWLIRLGVVLQHVTPSNVRASCGSIVNFTDALLSVAVTQFLGFMAGVPPHYLFPAQLLSVGSFVLAASLLLGYLLYGRKKPILS